jgi:hypothetical protein
MRRLLAAAAAAAAALACAAAALAAPPPQRGHEPVAATPTPAPRGHEPVAAGHAPALVVTELDHGTAILTNRLNPCTQALDLTIAFTGVSLVHITETSVGGSVLQAHVIVHEVGSFTTTLGGTTFAGRVNFLSVVDLNPQNSVAVVHDDVRAVSSSGASLRFRLLRTVTFDANNPLEPVSSVTRVSASGCPATAARPEARSRARSHGRTE